MNREDGYAGLARRYGFRFPGTPKAMDLGLTYRALAEGQVDLIAGDSTNGLVASLDLTQLRDDLHYFPPYEAVPVFNAASLRRHPEAGAGDRSPGGPPVGLHHAQAQCPGGAGEAPGGSRWWRTGGSGRVWGAEG